MQNEQSFQQTVLGQLDIQTQNNNIQLLSHTTHKNSLKLDQRPQI